MFFSFIPQEKWWFHVEDVYMGQGQDLWMKTSLFAYLETNPSTLTINHLAIYKQLSSIDVNVLWHLGIDFVAW